MSGIGLDAPCADVGVPAAVVFARLDVDRDGVGGTLFQPGDVFGLVEERHADFACERAFVHLEHYVLALPVAACGGAFRHGHYFVNGSFEFHGIDVKCVDRFVCDKGRKKIGTFGAGAVEKAVRIFCRAGRNGRISPDSQSKNLNLMPQHPHPAYFHCFLHGQRRTPYVRLPVRSASTAG